MFQNPHLRKAQNRYSISIHSSPSNKNKMPVFLSAKCLSFVVLLLELAANHLEYLQFKNSGYFKFLKSSLV